MSGTGTTQVDFGAFPGGFDASVAVTGQGSILASSLVEAWIFPDATTDHSEDEHTLEPVVINVKKSSITAGTGFTITATVLDKYGVYGKFNVAWVWA